MHHVESITKVYQNWKEKRKSQMLPKYRLLHTIFHFKTYFQDTDACNSAKNATIQSTSDHIWKIMKIFLCAWVMLYKVLKAITLYKLRSQQL